ncbi:hypothetical protein NOR_00687 [Metarhizium rileyi]|uniref:Uncharacterized protein n=2 Tax=Metarhizium rileyi (strain RCEF 4871) TaxID=1649241 RepID=A0A167KRP6_METRR|nr:hypothetical protein NOR_00687 [Metarhizium rileyi RCEF 4871]
MTYITTNLIRISRNVAPAYITHGHGRHMRPTALLSVGVRTRRQEHTESARKYVSSPANGTETMEAKDAALRAVRMKRTVEGETKAAMKEAAKKDYQRRYDVAARKWVSTMIALPILIVTSYYLFDRLALGNGPKTL